MSPLLLGESKNNESKIEEGENARFRIFFPNTKELFVDIIQNVLFCAMIMRFRCKFLFKIVD